MDTLIDKLQEILIILKESHKYQSEQNVQFTHRSQLIFVVVALYFNVAFITINTDNIIILILKIILLIFLGFSIFWTLSNSSYQFITFELSINNLELRVPGTKIIHSIYFAITEKLARPGIMNENCPTRNY